MSLLQPAAPLTLWCDEPNWWDGVEPAATPEDMLAELAALEMNTLTAEDEHTKAIRNDPDPTGMWAEWNS